MTRSARTRLVAVLVLPILLLVLGIAYVFYSYKAATEDVTDPNRYRAILNDLGYPTPTKLDVPTLAHFPSDIPPAASNVRFFYRPGFLQGGTQLQLRVNLPAADVAALLAAVRPAAREIQRGGDRFDTVNARQGLPSALFRDSANRDFAVEGLPVNFKVFILDARDSAGPSSTKPSWNHGYSYGVAIDEKAREVIYWVDDW